MTDALLLPSAILIPDELRLDLGRIPTGMIPLHGKPALRHIVERYDDVDPYVACGARANLIEQYVDREDLDWTLIDVGSSESLGDTVERSIEHITDRREFDDDRLYINFADTIVEPCAPATTSEFVSYAEKENQIRWTSFTGTDRIESITRKQHPRVTGVNRVFTGVFRLADPARYLDSLAATPPTTDDEPDRFYRGLLDYLSDRRYELLEAERWVDVGHLDTYYAAKKEFLNVREFNSLDTDDDGNVITKSSRDREKLAAEYAWYTALPEDLKSFVPHVYGYDEPSGSLRLEYVGYPSLRDLFLHSSHGLHTWNHIFASLFSMMETFGRHRTTESVRPALESMYVDKTVDRLGRVDVEGPLGTFFEPEVRVNGTLHDGVPRILDRVADDLERAGLFDLDEFTVIHGDLCFSNVLFGLRNGAIKLVDPRGSFGPHTVYGDPRYDLAKLRHSVAGSYDLVINDLFEVEVDDGAVEYEVYRTDDQDDCRDLFDSLLEQEYPDWSGDVRLVESLLFLSMVPLHSDAPDRQQYMLARGIEQFNAECPSR